MKRTKEEIIKLLEENDWKVAKVASLLGITRQRVYQIIEKFSITIPKKYKKIKVNCQNCGKEIEVYPRLTTIQKKFFCSKECKENYYKIKLICPVCKNTFLRRKKEIMYRRKVSIEEVDKVLNFCSKRCMGIWLGTHYGRYARKKGVIIDTKENSIDRESNGVKI